MTRQIKASTDIFVVQVRFAPQPLFVNVLPRIAERVQKANVYKHWMSDAQRFEFMNEDNRSNFSVDFNSCTLVARSKQTWEGLQDEFVDLIKIALEEYSIEKVDSVEYMRNGLFDLGMSFAEMARLGIESTISSAVPVMSDCNDWMVVLVNEDAEHTKRVEFGPLQRSDALLHLKNGAEIRRIQNVAFGENLKALADEITGDRLFIRTVNSSRNVGKLDLQRTLSEFKQRSAGQIEMVVKKLTNVV